VQTWVWPGLFAIDVPDDWSVVETDGGIVEVVPPTRGSACHISAAGRSRLEPPTLTEAEALVRRLLPSSRSYEPVISVQEFPDHLLAATSLLVEADGDPSRWEVGVRLSHDRVISWSFTDDGQQDRDHTQALAIAASLRPSAYDPWNR
jgi:hypothetical protein